MKKRSLLIAATSCFISLAPAAHARSAHDGFQLQLHRRCDQRNRHASQSREISRLRCKIRRGSRFGDNPG